MNGNIWYVISLIFQKKYRQPAKADVSLHINEQCALHQA